MEKYGSPEGLRDQNLHPGLGRHRTQIRAGSYPDGPGYKCTSILRNSWTDTPSVKNGPERRQ